MSSAKLLLTSLVFSVPLAFASVPAGAQSQPLSGTATPVDRTPRPVQRDAQALQLLAQSYAAMGGSATQNIHSVSLTGTVRRQRATGEEAGTVLLKIGNRDKYRYEEQFPTSKTTQIVDGRRGISVADGKAAALPLHSLLNHWLKLVPVLTELSDAQDPSWSATYVGLETLDQATVHHIRLWKSFSDQEPSLVPALQRLSTVDLYIDSTTLLVQKRSQLLPAKLSYSFTFPLDQVYSDYRSVQGILVPHTVTTFLRGQEMAKVTFSDAQATNSFNSADFEVAQ